MSKLANPIPIFLDGRGALLDAGYIYIGTAGADPEVPANRLSLFWDKALTIPAAQPLRTLGGVIVNGANLGFVYFAQADFSMVIRDADAQLVAYLPTALDQGVVSYQPLDSDLTAIAALATTSFGRSALTLADAASLRALGGLGAASLLAVATAAEYRANVANRVLTTDQVWAAAAPVPLAQAGGTVAVDLSTGLNFTLAMSNGPWTLDNPQNSRPGAEGSIEITQDATGGRVLSFGNNWKFAGGSDPVLSTAPNAKDVLSFKVLADGVSTIGSLIKAIG